jgi:hypothetical protein
MHAFTKPPPSPIVKPTHLLRLRPQHVWMRQEAQRAQAVRRGDDNHVVVRGQLPAVHLVGGSLREVPAMKVHHHWGSVFWLVGWFG